MTLPYSTSATGSPLPAISISELLAPGKPFVGFPTYNILDLKRETGFEGSERDAISPENSDGFSRTPSGGFGDWLCRKLQIGHPFVIKGFDKLPEWDRKLFSIEGLIECSTRKSKSFLSIIVLSHAHRNKCSRFASCRGYNCFRI
jgi:hypothetical protein